jgi:hypothetical protein
MKAGRVVIDAAIAGTPHPQLDALYSGDARGRRARPGRPHERETTRTFRRAFARPRRLPGC